MAKATIPRLLHCCSLGIFLSVACACENSGTIATKSQDRGIEDEGSVDALFELDFKKPRLQQAIDPGNAENGDYKFVKIAVAHVINPKKIPLNFELRFQGKGSAELLLGVFSLYPSDNPGDFIVATQGKLKEEGLLVLSMVTPDHADGRELIKVGVRKLKFL